LPASNIASHVNGIQAMPLRKNGGGSAGSTASGGSGGAGAGAATFVDSQNQNKMPGYLGQQAGMRQFAGQQQSRGA
jgi:hypothetical protein